MKKTIPSGPTPECSNPKLRQSSQTKPHAAEGKLRALAAQEEQRTLTDQEERRAQAGRTPARKPAHAALIPAALIPAALVPAGPGSGPESAKTDPLGSQSSSRKTPNCTFVHIPINIDASTPRHCPPAQTIQEDCRELHENCRTLLAWYEEYAEETEQRQQQIAEEFADWQQSRSRRTPHPNGGGVLHQQASPFARPLPLRSGKRTPLGRAHLHWETPEGRLLVQVRLCEAVLLPKMRAQNAGERDAVNAQIAAVLGLADAADAGLLTGFLVFWQATGRWPRRPVSVQLFWPGGSRQGARLRGEYGSLMAQLQKSAQAHFS